MVVCGTWLAFFFLFNGSYGVTEGSVGPFVGPPFVPIILEENHMGPLDFS